MNAETMQQMLNLLQKEVVPALGCTEPITVALAAARAAKEAGGTPESVKVELSGNVLKNGMSVGVPGTGMTGLDIAAAIGAIGGNPDLGLEALRDITPSQVEEAKKMLTDGKIRVELSQYKDPLFVAVSVKSKNHTATAIIQGSHTNLVKVLKDDKVVWEKPEVSTTASAQDKSFLNLKSIYAFATAVPFKDIEFILEGERLNMAIAKEGLSKPYGLQLGRTLQTNISKGLLADDTCNYALMLTAGAIDARMDGAMLPVMSNSGSGDQGLTCTLPIVAFAERLKADREQLARALVMGNLAAIHVKQFIGRLSALCGTTVAAIGACCGIVLLMGGKEQEMARAVNSMIGNVTGIICDGAKNSCALKANSSVGAAIYAAMLAMSGLGVTGKEGIVNDDVEESIRNLGRLTKEGMAETDKVILDIMIKKTGKTA
ncbi:serine dehydratase subunit alpha family protein [Desulfovibrio litoralis]|uniref:UPF0597 protein SAMN02745728_00935 n=1 Tax=Desulfovibrio litoralis DSM 11393 TaxID=1121455 RepID=A0A1M7SGS9_9BACT|nr:L-serine ammonia-lyase, iron-sulfur-dependent, subunit alpha [Desulfovibrio litoralis]SHN57685.1 L-cysteine desulfidase [Desulfovibrio litoralis DSM 11393]